ncbi:MAG: anti-sigma factor family protein, partial [Vicinamibacteria bacterium]
MGEDAQHPTDALQDALDHRLDPAKLAELEAHVATCAACRRELDALRWTKAQAGAARSLELPPGFEVRLRGALDEEDRVRGEAASEPRGRFRRLAPWLAAAAALAAAIWMGGRFWTSSIP